VAAWAMSMPRVCLQLGTVHMGGAEDRFPQMWTEYVSFDSHLDSTPSPLVVENPFAVVWRCEKGMLGEGLACPTLWPEVRGNCPSSLRVPLPKLVKGMGVADRPVTVATDLGESSPGAM